MEILLIALLIVSLIGVYLFLNRLNYYEVTKKFVESKKGDIFLGRKIRTEHGNRVRLYTKASCGYNHVVKLGNVKPI